MQYSSIGKAPGSLLSKNAKQSLMKNPGKSRDYDMAESLLVREAALVRDLVGYFLKSPTAEKANDYWIYFQEQWKQNIVNYIKNINGQQIVHDIEVDQYKNHYKYRTAIRLVEEFTIRSAEMDKVKSRFPNLPPEKNKTLFGLVRAKNEIHARLMPLYKQIKDSVDSPDLTIKR